METQQQELRLETKKKNIYNMIEKTTVYEVETWPIILLEIKFELQSWTICKGA